MTTHLLGEVIDHRRVGNVLALRGHRHQEMIAHQPNNQVRIPRRQAMAIGKALDIHGPFDRMVGVPTLADIVIQRGDVDQLHLGQFVDDLGGNREAFAVGGVAKGAQIPDG